MKKPTPHITEPQRRVPVLRDVDVVVAGAGTAGLFAALGAAKEGAKTLLVDRFADMGGGYGAPGLVTMGAPDNEAMQSLVGGLAGISKEFVHRLDELRGESPRSNSNCANIASYVAGEMMRRYRADFLGSVWAADPILRGRRVAGIFLETKSGRRAVRAKVTIDGTGDAEIAQRAGAEILRRQPAHVDWPPLMRGNTRDPKWAGWNDTAVKFLVSNIDAPRYRAFLGNSDIVLSEKDRRAFGEKSRVPDSLKALCRRVDPEGRFWGTAHFTQNGWKFFSKPNLPLELNAYHDPQSIARARHGAGGGAAGEGQAEGWMNVAGESDYLDAVQVSALEQHARARAFEFVRFHRDHVPGFERAYLHFIAPYMGARGGPHIVGEHVLTPEESHQGARFEDVLYVNIHEALHGGAPQGFDVPYRVLVPRGIEGLLVTGRGASYLRRGHDPSGMRCRPTMLLLGQAAGVAAALLCEKRCATRALNVKSLQRRLLKEGFHLGDAARLRELGLSAAKIKPQRPRDALFS